MYFSGWFIWITAANGAAAAGSDTVTRLRYIAGRCVPWIGVDLEGVEAHRERQRALHLPGAVLLHDQVRLLPFPQRQGALDLHVIRHEGAGEDHQHRPVGDQEAHAPAVIREPLDQRKEHVGGKGDQQQLEPPGVVDGARGHRRALSRLDDRAGRERHEKRHQQAHSELQGSESIDPWIHCNSPFAAHASNGQEASRRPCGRGRLHLREGALPARQGWYRHADAHGRVRRGRTPRKGGPTHHPATPPGPSTRVS